MTARASLSFAAPERALVREVAATYAACLREDTGATIDVDAARLQHAAYVGALRELGVVVDVLGADDACPDGCFVEDTAVVLGDVAIATRPGAASRRAEVDAIARALAADRDVRAMQAPATLDGGDVLRAGATLFVGLSRRTNRASLDLVREAASSQGVEVVPLEVADGLHLKSSCTLATESIVVHAPTIGAAALEAFRAAGLECVAAIEPAGANVLALGGAVLVSAAAPRTAELLAARGLPVRLVDVGEIHKGDGALTCLSIRLPRRGTWCT